MAAVICGSLAFDTIMTFEGRFAEQILPDQLHILNVSFLVPGIAARLWRLRRQHCLQPEAAGWHAPAHGDRGQRRRGLPAAPGALGISAEFVRQVMTPTPRRP
jgi:adenosine kinase